MLDVVAEILCGKWLKFKLSDPRKIYRPVQRAEQLSFAKKADMETAWPELCHHLRDEIKHLLGQLMGIINNQNQPLRGDLALCVADQISDDVSHRLRRSTDRNLLKHRIQKLCLIHEQPGLNYQNSGFVPEMALQLVAQHALAAPERPDDNRGRIAARDAFTQPLQEHATASPGEIAGRL